MFFYGIHGIEKLFALMGTGCETVTRIQGKDADLVSGVLERRPDRDLPRHPSRTGFVRAVVFGERKIVQSERSGSYEDLCGEIGKFFKTGEPPVSAEETIEIFAFMEAADESKRQGGAPVSLAEVLAKARMEAAAKIKE